MFASRLLPRLRPLHGATRVLQSYGDHSAGRVLPLAPSCFSTLKEKPRSYATAAGNTPPPQWVQLEPELEDALIPRKLSMSPLESWLSLRYSLPPLLEAPQLHEEAELLEEKMLPPLAITVLEDGNGPVRRLRCKNVVEIRRRKVNHHKYKKLQKRTKFLRKKVLDGRRRRKQKQFEKDLTRIWKKAGLEKAPEGWTTPKIYIK